MENQHRKIKGYRELSQQEIDLMNRIKAKGSELLELQAELADMLNHQHVKKAVNEGLDPDELARFRSADPIAWAGVGKVDIQTGIMALVRAVAQPEGV